MHTYYNSEHWQQLLLFDFSHFGYVERAPGTHGPCTLGLYTQVLTTIHSPWFVSFHMIYHLTKPCRSP